jgi:hypothetical protein
MNEYQSRILFGIFIGAVGEVVFDVFGVFKKPLTVFKNTSLDQQLERLKD